LLIFCALHALKSGVRTLCGGNYNPNRITIYWVSKPENSIDNVVTTDDTYIKHVIAYAIYIATETHGKPTEIYSVDSVAIYRNLSLCRSRHPPNYQRLIDKKSPLTGGFRLIQ